MKNKSRFIAALLTTALTAGSMGTYAVMGEEAASQREQISSQYRETETKYRPYARWWLAEGSHTDETLKEAIKDLYDAGYG